MMVPIFSGPQALNHSVFGDSKNKKSFPHISGHIPLGTCGITSMLPTFETRRGPGLVFPLLFSRPRVPIGVDVFRPQIYCISK
jgi:hypothetical protein